MAQAAKQLKKIKDIEAQALQEQKEKEESNKKRRNRSRDRKKKDGPLSANARKVQDAPALYQRISESPFLPPREGINES